MQQLAHESTGDLARIKGMTPARAAMVVAGVELDRRTLTRPRPDRTRLSAPRDVAAFLLPHYGASPVECFCIVSLCTKHRLLRTEIVSTGTLDASLVHPREVFRTAAMHRAAAIVLFHNHPNVADRTMLRCPRTAFPSVDGSNPAISGHRKAGHFRRPETAREFYFMGSRTRKDLSLVKPGPPGP